jgi:hypothetical protein
MIFSLVWTHIVSQAAVCGLGVRSAFCRFEDDQENLTYVRFRDILTIYITVFVTRGRHFGARESV